MRLVKLFGLGAFFVVLVIALSKIGLVGLAQADCTVIVQPSQSIQEAIDEVSEGAVICLTEGTYKESIRIEKSLALRGVSQERTMIISQGPSVVLVDGRQEIHIVIEHLTIAEARGTGIHIEGRPIVSLNAVAIIRNGFYGLVVDGLVEARVIVKNSDISFNGWGVLAKNAGWVSFRDSRISHNDISDGIEATDAAEIILYNTEVSHNRRDGLELSRYARAEIIESVFRDNRECGIHVFSQYAHVTGTPSRMHQNGADLCGFVPAHLRQPLVAETTRMYVSVPDDFKTLQEACDAVAPGGTIYVAAGTYELGLTIWKPVTIQGAGIELTTLEALPERYGVSLIAGVSKVILQDLRVTGAFLGLYIYGDITLQNVQAFDNQIGFLARGTAQVLLNNSVVIYNRAVGILAGDSAAITITNSELYTNGRADVELVSLSRVSLQESIALTGMNAYGASRISIKKSQVSGVALFDSAHLLVRDSEISRSKKGVGLYAFETSRAVVENSTISDNEWGGIVVSGETHVEVRSSTIEGNGTGFSCPHAGASEVVICNGITVYDQAHITINNSVIRNNTDWGIASYLRECGYDKNSFNGSVIFEGTNKIEDNNKSGNQNGMGNPGNHPWNRPGVPDGQVCLP